LSKRNGKQLLAVYLRGLAMGAADVVPGVSGGTIAFITGIYQELIDSIKSINPAALTVLFKQGPAQFWAHINGTFLLLLLLGIATSVLSLARLISYLLVQHPLLIWSFFFGLIAASSLHMAKQIRRWRLATIVSLLVGCGLAYAVTELSPSQVSPDLLMFFAAGSVAICAMILPGISGSFILLLLGMYTHILAAVKNLEWLLLLSFMAGCGIGLLSFSHLLSWLFRRFHDLTMALLTGFLVGSLNLVWPWKLIVSYYQNSKGEQVALQQQNVMPWLFEQGTGVNPATVYCLGLMFFGILLVLLLEKVGNTTPNEG
jgi:putative membrane protein